MGPASGPGETDEQSRFNPGPLPLPFQWLRTPAPDRIFSTEARPGWLRLFGRESIGSWFEQALVARRQTEHSCKAEVTLDFTPNSFQQMAGLTAYYGRHQFYYLYVTQDDAGQRRLAIQHCAGDWPEAMLTYPLGEGQVIADGHLHLGLDIDRDRLQFRFASDATQGAWQPIGPQLDASVLSDEGGRGEHANFTGCFLGMAAQDITGMGHKADFADFRYIASPRYWKGDL